jgi:rsbT antagonist protein RsbS
MSTTPSGIPILRLWNRLLITLQGEITDKMAERLSEEVLTMIHRQQTHGLIIDVTEVLTLDSHLCFVLSQLASAAKLMGCPTVLSGMSAHTAQTLETMGIRLRELKTSQSAETALELLGVEVRLHETMTTDVLHNASPIAGMEVDGIDLLGGAERWRR